jgi:hypothetical protein
MLRIWLITGVTDNKNWGEGVGGIKNLALFFLNTRKRVYIIKVYGNILQKVHIFNLCLMNNQFDNKNYCTN